MCLFVSVTYMLTRWFDFSVNKMIYYLNEYIPYLGFIEIGFAFLLFLYFIEEISFLCEIHDDALQNGLY